MQYITFTFAVQILHFYTPSGAMLNNSYSLHIISQFFYFMLLFNCVVIIYFHVIFRNQTLNISTLTLKVCARSC